MQAKNINQQITINIKNFLETFYNDINKFSEDISIISKKLDDVIKLKIKPDSDNEQKRLMQESFNNILDKSKTTSSLFQDLTKGFIKPLNKDLDDIYKHSKKLYENLLYKKTFDKKSKQLKLKYIEHTNKLLKIIERYKGRFATIYSLQHKAINTTEAVISQFLALIEKVNSTSRFDFLVSSEKKLELCTEKIKNSLESLNNAKAKSSAICQKYTETIPVYRAIVNMKMQEQQNSAHKQKGDNSIDKIPLNENISPSKSR